MKLAIAYVYPAVQAYKYLPLAKRFVNTWTRTPPGQSQASLHVFVNGPEPSPACRELFSPLVPEYHQRDNSGWDIGAFQEAADKIECDLLVCFGACVHFHRPGWLDRIVESVLAYGVGLYGCAGYLSPNWHVRTTSFWCAPQILQSYPDIVGSTRQSRYEFEHGNKSFTRHVLSLAMPCVMVTWNGFYPFEQWSGHEPDLNTILCRDQHIHA